MVPMVRRPAVLSSIPKRPFPPYHCSADHSISFIRTFPTPPLFNPPKSPEPPEPRSLASVTTTKCNHASSAMICPSCCRAMRFASNMHAWSRMRSRAGTKYAPIFLVCVCQYEAHVAWNTISIKRDSFSTTWYALVCTKRRGSITLNDLMRWCIFGGRMEESW